MDKVLDRIRAAVGCAAFACAACGDITIEPGPPDAARVTAEWQTPAFDPIAGPALVTPAHTPRFVADEPVVCYGSGFIDDGVEIVAAELGDEALVLTPTPSDDDCLRIAAPPRTAGPLAPGDVITVTIENDSGEKVVVDRTLPAIVQAPIRHQAVSALRTPDGTTWSATPQLGLVGVTSAGAVIQYGGVPASEPWDPTAREPQSVVVLALEADPHHAGAMWLATAATGVSWFDPGADALDARDDTWLHGEPLDLTISDAKMAHELAQTSVAIAPDPTRPDTLWVASLNGVYRAHKTADRVTFTRVADGVALAIAVAETGHVWVGFTRQLELTAEIATPDGQSRTIALPRAEAALLRLDPGADAINPSDDTLLWTMHDEDAVTTILPQGDGAWVGTPYRLERASVGDEGLVVAPTPLVMGYDDAVTELAPSRSGFWLATRDECFADRGHLFHVTLDASGAIEAIADRTDVGFGERDFNDVRELADGSLLVSTLVPGLHEAIGETGTARGCAAPDPLARDADLYELPADGSPARRFEAR